MELETKNTEALIYEINNFHLKWEKYIDEEIARQYNRSEYALFYNGSNMWDVYNAASTGSDYESKVLKLYENCINEIDKNSLNLRQEDRVPYLKKILPKFYTNEPNKEQVTYLSIQEQNIQDIIYSYHTGHDFMAEGEGGGSSISNFITISVSGFDTEEFKHHSYHCLNEQEEFYLDDLSEEDNNYWDIRRSFVKTILSIKRNTFEKLEQQINKWIELEGKTTETKKKIFNHTLTEKHFDMLLALVNEIHLFNKDINIEELKSIFNCNISNPFNVNNNQNLAFFFNSLCPKFIASEWQSVIEQNKLFIGKRGKMITAKNLSKSYNEADSQSESSKKITSTIEKMK